MDQEFRLPYGGRGADGQEEEIKGRGANSEGAALCMRTCCVEGTVPPLRTHGGEEAEAHGHEAHGQVE